MRKVNIKWEQIWAAVTAIVKNLDDAGIEINQVYGIDRGGVIPAAMIARQLGINVKTISVKGGWPDWIYERNTLLVDDIFDTGETINAIFERADWKPGNTRVVIATLHSKKVERRDDLLIPDSDFHTFQYEADEWLVYPWENEND